MSEAEQEQQGEAAQKAREEEKDVEEAREQMDKLEEGDPPGDLAEWPGGKAKYQTYGGPEGESGYDEGPTAKLGPSSLRHHEDGSVSIEGEKVDDPEEYKGEPIPGGPSDPDAPPDPAMIGRDEEDEDSDDSSDDGDDSDDSDDSDDER
jgi:hypothetical protein